ESVRAVADALPALPADRFHLLGRQRFCHQRVVVDGNVCRLTRLSRDGKTFVARATLSAVIVAEAPGPLVSAAFVSVVTATVVLRALTSVTLVPSKTSTPSPRMTRSSSQHSFAGLTIATSRESQRAAL